MKFCTSIIILLGGLFLTGCQTGKDGTGHLENFPPFNNYIGKPLELKQPAFLKEYSMPWSRDYILISEEDKAAYEKQGLPYRGIVFTLPAGTSIQLLSISREFDAEGGDFSIVTEGEVVVSNKGKIHFEYCWGYGLIERAPWESMDVPEKRQWNDDLKKLVPVQWDAQTKKYVEVPEN